MLSVVCDIPRQVTISFSIASIRIVELARVLMLTVGLVIKMSCGWLLVVLVVVAATAGAAAYVLVALTILLVSLVAAVVCYAYC